MMDSLLALLPQLRLDLTAAADPSKAPVMAAYMQHIAPFLGVNAPDRRRVQRELVLAAAHTSADELLTFAEVCWDQPEREFQYVATDMLRKGAGQLGSKDIRRVTGLLRAKSWWDTIDPLAAWTVGPMVLAYPDLVDVTDEWIDDDEFWIARAAILHQLSFAERTDQERLFRYVDRRAADTEFFIRKALGWALRQYARVQPEAVRSFVAARQNTLSNLTRREALKRIADPER